MQWRRLHTNIKRSVCMKLPILADQLRCTGCGACANVCPVHAISMIPNSEGFLMPHIDGAKCIKCGMCENTCPVLKPQYINDTNPACYAVTADDEIRKNSSSGGMFTLIAEEILSRGGVVFGAAWNEQWTVDHISVSSAEQLDKLRVSKYMQSNIGMTYQEAKNVLEAGRPILYTGVPCQIAGLKAYLKKDYPNLYAVEIMCHGSPSPKAFQKYLKDNFAGREIVSINHRDKSVFKWSSSSNVYFKDGTAYHANHLTDPFFRAFLPNMISRRSCAQCPFATTPRQGDITMSDFWGSERHRKGINDAKGLSAILVNNQRGRELFEQVRSRFTFCEQVDIETIVPGNPTLRQPFRAHPGRKHFFSSMDIKPFNELVEASLNHHYDIGIVGLWYGLNYGSVLTYYALYAVLKDWGYDPVMLPKPNTIWRELYNDPTTIAQRFIWRNCNVLNPYPNQEAYAKANDICKDFVVGSDVVWNYKICGREGGQFFFLDWVKPGHKKIGYACSCGDISRIDGPEEYLQEAGRNLKKFDAVSVRENSSVDYLNEFSGRNDVEQVLDPVFLCRRELYEKAIRDYVPADNKKFVFAYLLNGDMKEGKVDLLKKASAQYDCEYRISGNPNNRAGSVALYGEQVMPVITVDSWLYHMKNCEMFIGDSYHGLCFALIFHRPFIVVFGQNARVDSLLKLLNLESRKVSNFNDPAAIDQILQQPIDWNDVDARLNASREDSEKWFREALTKDPAPVSDLDAVREDLLREIGLLRKKLTEQDKQMVQLRDELNQQKQRVDEVASQASSFAHLVQYYKENGFTKTLKKLQEKFDFDK